MIPLGAATGPGGAPARIGGPTGPEQRSNALPVSLDEEGGHEFPAAGDADLSEDVAQVLLRRVRRNLEPVGYPVGGMPPQDEFGDLLLARCQPLDRRCQRR